MTKVIKKEEAKTFPNSPTCVAYEYDLGDKDMNAAIIELNGRYPEQGRVVNEKCKEIIYIIKGRGSLVIEDETLSLEEGSMSIIYPGERYFFDGNITFIAPCIPAWSPDQHKMVE